MTKKKMVLIVDEPVDCLECPLYSEYGMECWYLRNAKYFVDERPPYCPLKPLPEKKEIDKEIYIDYPAMQKGYQCGWNDCIDEIIGEEE